METNTIVSNIGVLDIFFISVFLVSNIVLGLISRRKCWDNKEAVFGKMSNFSDFTLVTSLSATMIPASLLVDSLQQINVIGLSILITTLVMYPAMYFIITFWLVPRIVVTEMAFSWYEYIEKYYGKFLRIFFALCNLALYICDIASLFLSIQFVLQIIFSCPVEYSKFIGTFFSVMVIIYAAFGGLRAVTITDIFQFFSFFTIIVFLALFLWGNNPDMHKAFFSLFDGHIEKLTWKSCFGSHELIVATLSYWVARLIPDFPQAIYQRCYASKSLKKAKKNMLVASFIFLFFSMIIIFLALQIMALNSNLNQEEILPFLSNHLTLPGIKGLFFIAIIALAISTADSHLNACAVVLSNDIITPLLNINLSPSLIRKSTLFIGFPALIISLYAESILNIFMTVSEYTFPMDVFPVLFIMLGLKTSKKVIYLSMSTGMFSVFLYHFFVSDANALIIGAAVNCVTLIIAHLVWKKYFRSDDPNMYYNQKDNCKRLKDFEYDDDIMSYTNYKLSSGEWKEDLEEALRKQNEEEENAELQKRFHAIVKERMRNVVEEYDREKAEDEAYNRSVQEKKAQDYDRSIYKEKDATKDFYELKDLPETCAAYGIVKKAGHKMCRQDILNQYINESWQWKRNHPEDLNGPNNIYNDSIPVPEKIFGIKIMPKKEEKNEDPMQNITVDDFVDLRKRFKKAVKEKMEEMGLKYVPDIEDELELMKNEQENEQKIVKKYKELWLEEIRKEQEEEKKNKKKKK